MMNRRSAIFAATSFGFLFPACTSSSEEGSSFEDLLQVIVDDPAIITEPRANRVGAVVDYNLTLSRAVLPRATPSTLKISEDAIQLIVVFEVSSEANYRRRLENPYWPGGRSGLTLGIGYDLGYRTSADFRQDWGDYLSSEDMLVLDATCGVKGDEASETVAQTSSVVVDWDMAMRNFKNVSLPLYVGRTLETLPNVSDLNEDCRGALVSLVYNRGASFKLQADRYREMRNIRVHMEAKNYDQIPAELRSMKRLWENQAGMRGLLIRRELEAKLFENGLNA